MIISVCVCVKDLHPGNMVVFSANNIIPSSYNGINDSYFMMDSKEQNEMPDT